MFCKSTRMGFGEIEAQCPPNTYFDAKKAVWGIMSNKQKAFTHCHEDSISDFLWDNPQIIDCTKALRDRRKMDFTIMD